MTANGEAMALVLGATGGIGGATAEALLRHGWRVRALVRDPAAASALWRRRSIAPEWVGGDAMVRDDVIRGAAGVRAIVHAVNPPGYRHWDQLVLPMIDNSIAAARVVRARIILPGTIYNFDPAKSPLINADTIQQPKSRKGAVRVAMEQRLEAVCADVPSLIVRAGDFFGPRSKASWFAQAMVRPGKPVRFITNPGASGVAHSWAYLPDLAETIAQLMALSDNLGPFERVQFEGFWDADGTAMTAAIRRAVGNAGIPIRRFPWHLMRLLSPFGGFPREVAEIRPYWRAPVRLDNKRLVEMLGKEPRTSIVQAIRDTLVDMECKSLASARCNR